MKIYEREPNIVKKLVVKKKIVAFLKKYQSVQLESLKHELSMKKLEDQRNNEKDKDRKHALKTKVEVVKERIKSNVETSKNIAKRAEEIAKDNGLTSYFDNKKYIIDTEIFKKKLSIIDDPKKKLDMKQRLVDRIKKVGKIQN